MTLLGVVVMVLVAVSVVTLAFGGAEPPDRIQTLGRASPEEQAFERRALRLQVIGFASVALAVLVGVIGALELLV